MQGANLNTHLIATPPLGGFDAMDNEMVPEFIDQSSYYPAATNYYGYYPTGYESPAEWDDHNRFFGIDGPDLHYTGMDSEGVPYVYYTPSYGYAHSPYNPYNPYIPGALVGVDGTVVGQQYYSGSTYQYPSSPAYLPALVQPRPDVFPNTFNPALLNSGVPISSRPQSPVTKHIPSSMPTVTTHPRASLGDVKANLSEPSSSQMHSPKISESSQRNFSSSKQPIFHGAPAASCSNHSTSHVIKSGNGAGSSQVADSFSFGRVPSLRNQLKVAVPTTNSLADFVPNARVWAAADNYRRKIQLNSVLNNANGSPDMLGEQNRGPRTTRLKSSWTSPISVKAYTTKAGNCNAQGNIVIHADQFNRDDFPLNYANAKFFVIKSYSEDDVHKSIKYNVWSSTPNGNKRLDFAYEDSQRISEGRGGHCPIFLFFSVNASGQFCGLAEMIGPVDFENDMDFWQQDKWSGSFPVKWHMIKDVPNINFRHIILENNENKPVTNSRDTQEIGYIHGIEMLSIFKGYASKTSILDDFTYYEERQKIMQDEKSRLLCGHYNTANFPPPPFIPSSNQIASIEQISPREDEKKSFAVSSKTKAVSRWDQDPLPKETEKRAALSSKSTASILNPPSKINERNADSSKENSIIKDSSFKNSTIKDPSSNKDCITKDSSDKNPTMKVTEEKATTLKSANSSVNKAITKDSSEKNSSMKVTQEKATTLKSANSSRTVESDEPVTANVHGGNLSSDENDDIHDSATSIARMSSLSIGSRVERENGAGKSVAMTGSTAPAGGVTVASREGVGKSGTVTRSTAPASVVTVGSMSVKVNGFSESSSGLLTVGTISIDPRAVKMKNPENSANSSPRSC